MDMECSQHGKAHVVSTAGESTRGYISAKCLVMDVTSFACNRCRRGVKCPRGVNDRGGHTWCQQHGKGTCCVDSSSKPETRQPEEAQANASQPARQPRDDPRAPAAGQGSRVREVPLQNQESRCQSPHDRCQTRLPELYHAVAVLRARGRRYAGQRS